MVDENDDYGSFVEEPKTEDLTQLRVLIEKLHEAELQVAEAEETLKKKQTAVKTLQEIEIPDLMTRIGVKSFSTVNNITVEVKDDLQATVKEADRPEAFKWLTGQGHAGLIKTEVVVAFARAERDKATTLEAELRATFPGNVRQDEWIEPQTLKKFVKEQIEKNVKLPEQIFGVRKFKIAKIKTSKK